MPGDTIRLSKDGEAVEVPTEQAGRLVDSGWHPETNEEQESREAQQRFDDRNSGIGHTLAAGILGAARGATLGGSDVLARLVLPSGEVSEISDVRKAHPLVSGAGELAGMVGTAGLPTPAGILSRYAGEAAEGAKALGGLRGLAATTAISGSEGAAINAGMYLSDVALGDRDLTAEGMGGALGSGFAFGGVAGGATYGLEAGTMAARRMFSRVMDGGDAVAGDAASQWERKSSEILDSHDETARIARQRIDEIKQQRAGARDMKSRADAEIAQAKLDEFRSPTPKPTEAPPETVQTPTTAVGPAAPARPAAVPAPPGASLEEQLSSMKSQIDSGASLQDLNEARVSPVDEAKLEDALNTYADRRAKVNEWVSRIKNPRTAYEADATTAEGMMGGNAPAIRSRTTRALDEDVFVEQSGGNLRTIGKGEHGLEDITPNSRILARSNADEFSRGTVLDDAYQDAVERAARAETPDLQHQALTEAADIEQQIHRYVRATKPENAAVIDQIEKVRAGAGRTGYHAAFARAERQAERLSAEPGALIKANPEAEAEHQMYLAGKGPKGPVDVEWMKQFHGPSLVQDVHEASQVVGEYEKAAADLVDAVGDAAPQSAKDATAAYREAADTADRKAMDRTARAIDDHVQFGPVKETPAERIANAKAAKLEANAQIGKLKLEEGELKAKLPKRAAKEAVPEPKPVAEPEKPVGRLEKFHRAAEKVGTALEMAHMAGIKGVPSPSDIPVVGPLLGAYLKMRAFTGKLMGRIPASGEAKAAALAARTKDRLAQSVDRMLGLAEKSASAARNPAVTMTTVIGAALEKRLYDDGGKDAAKDASPRDQAAVRVRELAAGVSDPQGVADQVRQQMRNVTDPDLITAAEQFEINKIKYLYDNAPKQPPDNPLAPSKWTPSAVESTILGRRMAVADDPGLALAEVEQGRPTLEGAETLRAVYPKLFAQLQQRLLQRATEIQAAIPFADRQRMSLLYNVPLDRLSEPATIALLNPAGATTSPAAPTQNTAPPTPSVAGRVDLSSLFMTPSDRRAARR